MKLNFSSSTQSENHINPETVWKRSEWYVFLAVEKLSSRGNFWLTCGWNGWQKTENHVFGFCDGLRWNIYDVHFPCENLCRGKVFFVYFAWMTCALCIYTIIFCDCANSDFDSLGPSCCCNWVNPAWMLLAWMYLGFIERKKGIKNLKKIQEIISRSPLN